mgnify:CR=1 FL=1
MTNKTAKNKKAKYINPKVYDLYWDAKIPKYFKRICKNYIIVFVEDWRGCNEHKITIEDVVEYYATQAINISSGCREISTISGDWRNIDYLAKECIEIFKWLNIETLRRISRKRGLIPKF